MTTQPMPTVVRHDTVPHSIRSCGAMAEPDYTDFFTLGVPPGLAASPEHWARAVMEGSGHPAARVLIWQVILGLRLEPRPTPQHVAGWKIIDRGRNWITVQAASSFLTAEVVFHAGDREVCFATFIRYDRRIAALIWPPVSVIHRRAVPELLRHASRSLTRSRSS